MDPDAPDERSMAYLDIETSYEQAITVVGIHREDRGTLQLVGREVAVGGILEFLSGASQLLTYNGHRFDLPVIKEQIGLDLRRRIPCRDLMHDCWRKNLKGGLKAVEKKLGIGRATEGVDGRMAMRLWAQYVENDDEDALNLLLRYNREDIENLPVLRRTLDNLS